MAMDDEAWVQQQNPKIVRLEEENQRLSKLLGLIETYHAAAGKAPKWMTRASKKEDKRATACLQLSDLHLDEVVDPAQVGGLNAFNRKIGEQRLRRWANKACEMGDRFKHEWEGCQLFVDGDLVSGSIHEELRESNADVLPGTMVHWAPLLAAAIQQVVDFYGNLHVSGVVGNHGRLTVKKQAKRRGRNSWDWLLMQMVRSHLVNDARITWELAEGSYLFVPIYDRFVYMTHGDEVGGGAGWAGVWSPLGTIRRKGIELGAAHGIRPSYAVIGHWHQCILAHLQGISLNGAMKGWDEYAATLRLRPEGASQNWWVESPRNGVTIAGPLLLEDRRAEGW